MQISTIDSMLPTFKKVLLATDFSAASQAAFKASLRLCNELNASLLIVHIFEYAENVPPQYGVQKPELDSLYRQALSSLNKSMETAQGAGVSAEALMKSGVPALSILETIDRGEIDLAILGTNALHGFERAVFGSTAEEVLRKASCPVLTVGPQSSYVAELTKLEGPVIFATDFHRTTTHAIRYAASFCKITKSPLHCLHVLPRALETSSQSKILPQIMTEALHHVTMESGTEIDEPVFAVAYGSEISNAVVDYAKQHKARLIVLGVRQASMIAAHVPAHIAYRIITEAPCPVLTMSFASRTSAALAAACV